MLRIKKMSIEQFHELIAYLYIAINFLQNTENHLPPVLESTISTVSQIKKCGLMAQHDLINATFTENRMQIPFVSQVLNS